MRQRLRLVESETNTRAKTKEISQKAKDAVRNHDHVFAELELLLLAAEVQIVELKEEHRLEIAEKATDLSQIEEQIQVTVGNIQAEFQHVRSEATKTLEARGLTVAELENKLERHWQERQAQ